MKRPHFHSFFLDAVLSSSIVSRTDRLGIITFVNANFEKISGYTRDELLGQPHNIISSGHHPHHFWKDVWQQIARGKSWRGEVCNRARNGAIYWVDTFIYPYFNKQGKLVEYFSIRNDITQRKRQEEQLARSEAQLQSIFNSTTDVYFLFNRDMELITCNAKGKKFIGSEQPDRLEKDLLKILKRQDGFDERFQMALKGNAIELERENSLPNGTTAWHHVRYHPAYDRQGAIIGVSITLTNIQLRKKQEQALMKQNKVLSEIAWTQAHEMRRPVASILGLIQLLQMDNRLLSEAEFITHLKTMSEELDLKIRKNVKMASESESELTGLPDGS